MRTVPYSTKNYAAARVPYVRRSMRYHLPKSICNFVEKLSWERYLVVPVPVPYWYGMFVLSIGMKKKNTVPYGTVRYGTVPCLSTKNYPLQNKSCSLRFPCSALLNVETWYKFVVK